MSKSSAGVYEIVNSANNHRYVGSATNIRRRFMTHRSGLRTGLHHSRHLQNAWNKHGSEKFNFRALLFCAPRDLLFYEQRAAVAKTAAAHTGMKRSVETKAKISAKALGRRRSPEAVEKGASKRRGIPLSAEHAAKLIGNKHALGTKLTAERKAQISLQMTGMKRPKDAAYRAKIAATLRGRKATPEHRANQSAAQLGKKRGPYKKKGAAA